MKNLLAGLLLLGFVSNANAVFTDSGAFLYDSDSSLYWLDVTASQGQSYDYVSSQFGTGGLYEGWRYATGLEFRALVGNWTNTILDISFAALNYFTEGADNIDSLIQALGNTYTGNTTGNTEFQTFTSGIIGVSYSDTAHRTARLFDYAETDSRLDTARTYDSFIVDSVANSITGSFLVRTTLPTSVPEASSMYLLAFGLLGLFGAARRKV